MIKLFHNKSKLTQFLISIFSVLIVSIICYLISDLIGYRSVALILLFTLSLLAIFFSLYPVLLAAVLSALIWDYFFIPPFFTFHVDNTEDLLLLGMYFIIALLNGILTSKIKHAQSIIQQREEKLKAMQLYNTIFNSISHELRTPITTILAVTDNLIHNKNNISDNQRDNLQGEVLIAGNRLNRLVDNLLDMSRIDSGMLKPKMDWCDVGELINLCASHIQPDLNGRNLKIEIPKYLPFVKLDFGLTEQSVFNIVHNSTLYTQVNSTIIISASFENDTLILKICDDGPGFDEGNIINVFDKFNRAKTTKTGGLGLGLSISQGFIEAQGGTIKVQNALPHGALFTISIPTTTIKFEKSND